MDFGNSLRRSGGGGIPFKGHRGTIRRLLSFSDALAEQQVPASDGPAAFPHFVRHPAYDYSGVLFEYGESSDSQHEKRPRGGSGNAEAGEWRH